MIILVHYIYKLIFHDIFLQLNDYQLKLYD